MKDLIRFATKETVGTVDREKGVIYGVSVITVGEAKGHGMYVDETMLEQVLEKGQATGETGLKSRFDHPSACSRAIGTYTGRFHNFRRDDNKVRADLYLADVAAKSPDGDLRTYILDLAEEDPDAFGTSIVFRPDKPVEMDSAEKGKPGAPPDDDPYWLPHARVAALHHCDIVDEGAANDGLFGRPDYFAEQAERWATEHPGVIGKIMSNYFEWKQKQEEKKMSDELRKELDAQIAELTKQSETVTAELSEATKTIEGFEAVKAEAVETATEETRDGIFQAIKDRLENFEDASFVLETIELSDEEVKDKFIERTKAALKKESGETAVDFSDNTNNDDDAKFEDKVAEKVEAGLSRAEATKACVREYPELHEDYKKRNG